MKTLISIPDPIFEAAEKLARRLGVSRSQFYANAIDAWTKKHRDSGVAEQLNAVYAANPKSGQMEPKVEALQSRSLAEDDW